jgi:phage host-nuclease inhibitor protein Gam
MLLSLISLSDEEIETVTSAVQEWCHACHCEIDSSEGRRALTVAIHIVQAKPSQNSLIEQLSHRLGSWDGVPHE